MNELEVGGGPSVFMAGTVVGVRSWRLGALAAVGLVLGGCSGTSGAPRALKADQVTAPTIAPALTEPEPTVAAPPPTAPPTVPPTTAPEPSPTIVPGPVRAVVDVGSVGVPPGVVGVPEGDAGVVADALLSDMILIPAGPHVVTQFALDTIVDHAKFDPLGTQISSLEVGFEGTWAIEEVRDAFVRALPLELTDRIVTESDQSGSARTASLAAYHLTELGIRQLDVVVSQNLDQPAATMLTIKTTRYLTDDEKRLAQPPPLVVDQIAAELAIVSALGWRLDGYWYHRSANGAAGRVGLLTDLAGESMDATDQLARATSTTSRTEQPDTTVLETSTGRWRINHVDWPGASATFDHPI